jgi:Zn-dependent M28 family amino/carboxypeptidase
MKALFPALAILMLSGAAEAAPPSSQALAATAAKLRDKALSGDNTAWATVESLTTEIGPRLAGSPAAKRAADWGVARMKALGFENVHIEPFPLTAWSRGPESAEVVAPFPQKLSITGLGGSVPTPPGGIEAEAVIFPTYSALLAAPAGSLNGKIAVVTQAMIKFQGGDDYGALNANRRAGPSEAAKRGAVAYLLRSLSTDDTRLPHTGLMNYAPDAPKIPAAALSSPDGALLDAMAKRGQPIRIRLSLSSSSGPAEGYTVSGEIRGREKPDELVVIGGHLDSWDLGTGAVDDGAGIAITTAAAKLVADNGQPRRTIRVYMFGAEEIAASNIAFAAQHQSEAAKMVVGGEADAGAGKVLRVGLPPGAANTPFARDLANVLSPILIRPGPAALEAGSDFDVIKDVPFFNLRQDMSRYFDLHHAADDTLDKIDPAELNQAVAAWAATLSMIADSDVDFRSTMPK